MGISFIVILLSRVFIIINKGNVVSYLSCFVVWAVVTVILFKGYNIAVKDYDVLNTRASEELQQYKEKCSLYQHQISCLEGAIYMLDKNSGDIELTIKVLKQMTEDPYFNFEYYDYNFNELFENP